MKLGQVDKMTESAGKTHAEHAEKELDPADKMAEIAEKAHAEHERNAKAMRRLESRLKKFEILSVVLAVALAALVAYTLYHGMSTSASGLSPGQRLTGINAQLSGSELSVINNAPNSDFETAGQMLLNLTLPEEGINKTMDAYVGTVYLYSMTRQQYRPFIVNGKPSVIYVGAISCIYCAENRWAMALALSRFGSFSALYKGYSSLKDGDAPTLYWAPQNITGIGSADFKNYYSSSSINFFSAEYDSNISDGFQEPSSGYAFYAQAAQDQYNRSAVEYMSNISQFKGTPSTFFGDTFNPGADASVFGQPNSTTSASGLPPISYMTHAGILNQLKGFDTPFSIQEYAAADVYVAEICRAINNTAPACSLNAIGAIENVMVNGVNLTS